MPSKAVYLLAVPGFADWEPAHAVAEVRRSGGFRVEVLGLTAGPVTSMGGIQVLPTRTLASLDQGDIALLILPGGERWEQEPLEPELEQLLRALERRGTPVAAICGATLVVARLGFFQGRRHTSNGLDYLRGQVPEYREDATYVDEPAVTDRHLITASGLGDVEFAKEIMAALGVLTDEERSEWTRWFRAGRIP